MNYKNFHTLGSISSLMSNDAKEDLYEAIISGTSAEDLENEIIHQCNKFHGFTDYERDASIRSRFTGTVRIAFDHCYKPEHFDIALNAISKLDGDFSSSLSVIISNTDRFIGRDGRGVVRPVNSYGNLFKYTYSIRKVFSEVIRHDDLEVAHLLLASKRIKKIVEPNLHNLIVRAGVKGGACASLIQSKPNSINEYVMTLHNYVMADNEEMAKTYYNKTLTAMVGHLQIALLLEKCTKTSMLLMNSLLRDKADWYMGVCQKYLGPASYFDLYSRTPNPVTELKHFYDVVPKADRNAATKAIWKSIPEDLVLAIADSPKKAADLHGLTGHQSLLALTSNAYRRSVVERDLGV